MLWTLTTESGVYNSLKGSFQYTLYKKERNKVGDQILLQGNLYHFFSSFNHGLSIFLSGVNY